MMAQANSLSKSQSQTAAGLRLTIGRLAKVIRGHASAGLTPSQISAMATLEELGQIRISDLAGHEVVSAPVATRICSSLEDLGHIKRITDPQDKRACLVTLTKKGERSLQSLWEERTLGINARVQRLSKSEISILNSALPILDKLAKDA